MQAEATAAPRAQRGSLRALRGILPYVWPKERPDLKRTVAISLILMLFAKLVTVSMPFTYKWATDGLVAATGAQQATAPALSWIIGAPIVATLLYGITRIAIVVLSQSREGF